MTETTQQDTIPHPTEGVREKGLQPSNHPTNTLKQLFKSLKSNIFLNPF